ncbi:MAG TPA: ABC transporter ATP-binding protein [Thermoplasmata archaeon]|nr:ABC transporter ATP-binding protein [Thermoplasmata archaeon]
MKLVGWWECVPNDWGFVVCRQVGRMTNKEIPLVELQNVSKIYTEYGYEVHAVKDASFRIYHGESIAITGRSGSGKSTLLHLMSCLDVPTKGKVFIDGKDSTKLSQASLSQLRNRYMGFVFQNYTVLPGFTVLENVNFPGVIGGKTEKQLHDKAMGLLKTVGLAHRVKHLGVHLSGGEQQRVALARAMINDQKVLFADEPTGALDRKGAELVMDLMKKLNEEKRITLLFVTHELSLTDYAKRIIRLEDGRVISDE